MSCHGHLLEELSKRIRITFVASDVTLEEAAAMKEALDKYRKEQKK